MNLTDKLENVSRLGIDSGILIYLIEENEKYIDELVKMARKITEGQITAISASLTLTEVLVKPLKNKNIELFDTYHKILRYSTGFDLVNLTPEIATRAAQIRADYNLKPPDAIILATALESNCQAFLTNDKQFQQIKEIDILLLDELV
jgi:predicted nucleic acid-binding protein